VTPTIQQIIDTILTDIPGAPFAETVDTVKTGDPSQPVTGIVTTFLANHAVLQRAVDLGANFVITHEPTFYNHLDETDWLQQDPVYQAKRTLIDEHGIVIWRFHDYWHSHRPDGILTGILRELDWEDQVHVTDRLPVITLPAQPLRDLVAHLKAKLDTDSVRVVGPPEMACSKIGLLVGSPGGGWQIGALSKPPDVGIDALVTGEINEWETCEYVRDALAQGRQQALIVLGHAASEEAGMAYLVEWLDARFPDVTIAHVPTGDPFWVG
jgi:putative NIF3 family GTP cyclohydrolase 1 type 2